MTTLDLFLAALLLYLALGVLFAVPFAFRFAARLDPAAASGSTGFRLLILPGAALLWPVLALMYLRSRSGNTA